MTLHDSSSEYGKAAPARTPAATLPLRGYPPHGIPGRRALADLVAVGVPRPPRGIQAHEVHTWGLDEPPEERLQRLRVGPAGSPPLIGGHVGLGALEPRRPGPPAVG